MFESRVHNRIGLAGRFLRNRISRLMRATSRIPSATARNLSITVLMGCLSAAGQTLTTLYSFGSNPRDGADPVAGVVFDKAGNLVGAAAIGGGQGRGMLFELSPPATPGGPWTETILKQFHKSPDGGSPECRLIVTSTGQLVGTTFQGGTNNAGTAFALLPPAVPGDPWKERVLYNFGNFPGDAVNPNAGLLAKGQVYYGAGSGGANFSGAVFQLTPPARRGDPWTETILYSFAARGSGDAGFPSGELIVDKKGNLYGNALLGGTNDKGAVYEVSPPAVKGDPWTEKVLFSFDGTNGTLPSGRLLLDASGTLFGTTDGGGTGFAGTVFQLVPPAAPGEPWTQAVLYNFSGGIDGGGPAAGVVMKQGRLFGTAQNGGNGGPRNSGGVVFALDPPAQPGGAWTETVLYSFGGPDGFLPASLLTLKNGQLYGTTSQGGVFGTGTVFVLRP